MGILVPGCDCPRCVEERKHRKYNREYSMRSIDQLIKDALQNAEKYEEISVTLEELQDIKRQIPIKKFEVKYVYEVTGRAKFSTTSKEQSRKAFLNSGVGKIPSIRILDVKEVL